MITLYSVLPQGVGNKVHFFKSDSETVTSDTDELTSDID